MKTEDCWIMNGKCITTPPLDKYGYIYLITDDQGREYWGKKAFTHRKRAKLSKKAKALPENKGKRISVTQKDSGWLNYWGSCRPLLEYIKQRHGTHGFKREIIKICEDKQSLAYWEMHELVVNNVLFRHDCWNGNILSKFFKGKIK